MALAQSHSLQTVDTLLLAYHNASNILSLQHMAEKANVALHTVQERLLKFNSMAEATGTPVTDLIVLAVKDYQSPDKTQAQSSAQVEPSV